jgi:hypothetical protein
MTIEYCVGGVVGLGGCRLIIVVVVFSDGADTDPEFITCMPL